MSNTALPREAELRTWASRGIEVEGDVLVTRMPRLQAVVASGEEPAYAALRCWKDEQHRYIVDVKVQMKVALECQRCLALCELELSTQSNLCVVWNEDSIKELPSGYDPLVAGDISDLHALVEEELLLALPAVPMHDVGDCEDVSRAFGDSTADVVEEKESPFAALGALLKTSKAGDENG
jgi:uncharacterized protein